MPETYQQRTPTCPHCGYAMDHDDMVGAAHKQLADALDSLAFYRRRCELLQSMQSTMRDPERTILCDVLANGQLLLGPDCHPDASRYAPAAPQELIDWVVNRWHDEVAIRPLVNIHRRSLDGTWRQVLRRLGVDDEARLGPSHDDLLAARSGAKEGGAA